jgi:hypothetical protein
MTVCGDATIAMATLCAVSLLPVCWLVVDHLLLRDLGPYGIIFINIYVY